MEDKEQEQQKEIKVSIDIKEFEKAILPELQKISDEVKIVSKTIKDTQVDDKEEDSEDDGLWY
jgi:hypothetical protein